MCMWHVCKTYSESPCSDYTGGSCVVVMALLKRLMCDRSAMEWNRMGEVDDCFTFSLQKHGAHRIVESHKSTEPQDIHSIVSGE